MHLHLHLHQVRCQTVVQESSLPEDERSEVEADLECPVRLRLFYNIFVGREI